MKYKFLIISTLVCLFAFSIYESSSDQLDLRKQTIKADYFQLPGVRYSVPFESYIKGKCNIYLNLYTGDEIAIDELSNRKLDYVVDVKLKNMKGEIIAKEYLNEKSEYYAVEFRDGLKWELFWKFQSKQNENYILDISFNSNDKRFNKKFLEIYVQKDYDYAAGGFLLLFQFISKLVVYATLLLILITLIIYQYKISHQKKENEIKEKNGGQIKPS